MHLAPISGRRCVLGACLDDSADDLDEHPFQVPFQKKYLPPGVDLRQWMPSVEDEGALATCTASALAGAVEYLVARASGRHVDVSRMFLYYNQRLWANRVQQDQGGSLRDGIRVLHRLGVPAERDWPFSLDLLAVAPPARVYEAARRHRVVGYHRVPLDLDSIRGCLAGGIPIAFGTHIWRSFTAVGIEGLIPLPRVGDSPEGRHALLLVGYSDREQLVIVRNSWGTDWGNQGYGYLPYKYLLNPAWTHTLWAVRTHANVAFEDSEHVRAELQPAPPALPTAESLFGPTQAPAGFGLSPAAPAVVPRVPLASAAPTVGAPRPSLIGSIGALALGRKRPMEVALELALCHTGGLVSRITGSSAAGSLVGGIVQQLGPQLIAGSPLTLTTVGGAVITAAVAGNPLAQSGQDRAEAVTSPTAPEPADLTRVLEALRSPAPPAAVERHHWDDSYDEHSVTQAAAQGLSPAGVPPTLAGEERTGIPAGSSDRRALPLRDVPVRAAPEAYRSGTEAGAVALIQEARPVRPGTGVSSGVGSKQRPGELLLQRWQQLGAQEGPLGPARSGELALSDGQGRGLLCQNGSIVWRAGHDPIELVGSMFQTWLRTGAERGPLGYPVRRELQVTDQQWTARLLRFEGGLIVDWAHAGAEDIPPFILLGGDALYQFWLAAGAEACEVGAPLAVSLELPDRSARVLPCSNGAIVWTRQHGAQALTGNAYRAWCSAHSQAG